MITELHSEVILANSVDSKGRHIAFQIEVLFRDTGRHELNGGFVKTGEGFFGKVQKGIMLNNEFKQFGASQSGTEYPNEDSAITGCKKKVAARINSLKKA